MGAVLVVFESRFGQSAKIADRLGARIRWRHLAAIVEPASCPRPLVVDGASAAVIVAPVYNRQHPPELERFAREHARELNDRPSAFVSVSVGAISRLAFVRAGIDRIATRFLERTGWKPSRVVLVGGALSYPEYSRAMRLGMRLAARAFGLPSDPTKVHELTNWRIVDDLADFLVARVEREPLPALHA